MDRTPSSQAPDGDSAGLLTNRCRQLGHLLLAERAVFYVQILHTMLTLRRQHELEPLHEDLYEAVRPSQEQLAGASYTPEFFLQDLRQLQGWDLIGCRIEKERLRGYRDTRRRKFRYRLEDETTAFLLWLEDRRRDDLHPDEADTRDILEELSGTLREAARLINRSGGATALDLDTARAIVYRLARMGALSDDASRTLNALNVRLLSFAISQYDVAAARSLIGEVDHFLKRFLSRIHALRREIVPEIGKLRLSRHQAVWSACVSLMASERRATPHLLRAREHQDPDADLHALARFYAEGGALEQLCTRVNASALLVWRKLYAHLRELERRSHRLEDIRARIGEIARCAPDDTATANFIHALLAPARMIGDMHFWNETLKADPPEPRWEKHRVRVHSSDYLGQKDPVDGKPVVSLEDERLRRLGDWMQRAGLAAAEDASVRASAGTFADTEDFSRLLELARHGLLGRGARLRRIGFALTSEDTPVTIRADRQALSFRELLIAKAAGESRGAKDAS